MAGVATLSTSPIPGFQPTCQGTSRNAGGRRKCPVGLSAGRDTRPWRVVRFLAAFGAKEILAVKIPRQQCQLQGSGPCGEPSHRGLPKPTHADSTFSQRRVLARETSTLETSSLPSDLRSSSSSAESPPPLESLPPQASSTSTSHVTAGRLDPPSPALNQLGAKIRTLTLFAAALLLLSTQPCLLPSLAKASSSATDSVAASHLGQKIATALRASSFPDEAIVFLLATLPLLELRGAIPVAYWMNMGAVKASVLAITGNSLPVPLILLALGPWVEQAARSTGLVRGFAGWFLETTRKKAGPIQEFKWLGLMLFVAVPLPGTGAWTGAFAAHILGMPFWSALSANVVGVAVAGLLVNLLCTLGLKWALVVGLVLFIASTFVWSFLRWIRKGFSTEKVQG